MSNRNNNGGGNGFDNTNRGSLWLSDRPDKNGNDSWSGTINVEGKEYFINLYSVSSDNPNAPLYSVSVKEKQAQGGGNGGQRAPQRNAAPQGGQRSGGAPAPRREAPPARRTPQNDAGDDNGDQGGYDDQPAPRRQAAPAPRNQGGERPQRRETPPPRNGGGQRNGGRQSHQQDIGDEDVPF